MVPNHVLHPTSCEDRVYSRGLGHFMLLSVREEPLPFLTVECTDMETFVIAASDTVDMDVPPETPSSTAAGRSRRAVSMAGVWIVMEALSPATVMVGIWLILMMTIGGRLTGPPSSDLRRLDYLRGRFLPVPICSITNLKIAKESIYCLPFGTMFRGNVLPMVRQLRGRKMLEKRFE